MAFEKLKQFLFKMNLKVLVNLLVFLFVVILIIICTIIQVGLDFSLIDWPSWAANCLLLIGITMVGQISFEGIFTSYLYQKEGWKYVNAKKDYKDTIEKVADLRIYLWQYLENFQKQELRKARIDILNQCGIDNPTQFVDIATPSRIKALSQHPIYIEEIDYTWDTLTNFQAQQVFYAFNIEQYGNKKSKKEHGLIVDNPGADYYLNIDSEIVMTSILNEPRVLNKKIKSNQFFGRTLKILSFILVSIIWSAFTISEISDGSPTMWLNLISRLLALFGGALSGITTAMGTVTLIARKINSKTQVLQNFLTAVKNKEFTPINQNDLAKKHYEEYMKEQQEAIDSVITPNNLIETKGGIDNERT